MKWTQLKEILLISRDTTFFQKNPLTRNPCKANLFLSLQTDFLAF